MGILDFFNNKSKSDSQLIDINIFLTEADKRGTNIFQMSDFFGNYIKSGIEQLIGKAGDAIREVPIVDIGIAANVIKGIGDYTKAGVTYIADMDSISAKIKTGLEKGIYKIQNSKQVEGNYIAEIVDGKGHFVKGITLKEIVNSFDLANMVQNIATQAQLRQIYNVVDTIQNFQKYQIEIDRNERLVSPFLRARAKIVDCSKSQDREDQIRLLNEAYDLLENVTTSALLNLKTEKNILPKMSRKRDNFKELDVHMNYVTEDILISTKALGIELQVLEKLGKNEYANEVLENYKCAFKELLTDKLDSKGNTMFDIMQLYYPYNKNNLDFWYRFKENQIALINNLLLENQKLCLLEVHD